MRIAEICFSPEDKFFRQEMKRIINRMRIYENRNFTLEEIGDVLADLAQAIRELAMLYMPLTINNCYDCPFHTYRYNHEEEKGEVFCIYVEKWMSANEAMEIPDWCPFLKQEVQDD